MAFQTPLDGAVVTCYLGTSGQTKVSGDRQRETTHEICCLAAEYIPFQLLLTFCHLILVI